MYTHLSATYKAYTPRLLLNITGLTFKVATDLSLSDINVSVTKQVFVWVRPAAIYVSGAGLWGTHSSPSRSSNRRRFWGILSCRCMFPPCIQRSSPLFWCTVHFVGSCHRRFRHLENSNTDCMCDEFICGLIPGRGKRFFSRFQNVKTCSGTHPASYSVCAGGFFPAGKEFATWNWQLTNNFTPPYAFMASLGSNLLFY
jgi:hypothetical protein